MIRFPKTSYIITEKNIGELSHHFNIIGVLGDSRVLELELGNNKDEAELLRSALALVQPRIKTD
jgi:hypothetical protein